MLELGEYVGVVPDLFVNRLSLLSLDSSIRPYFTNQIIFEFQVPKYPHLHSTCA